jgi:hypothetical protein
MVKGLPFLKKQLSFTSTEQFFQDLNEWMKYTRKISKGSALKFQPKIQLKFPTPLNKLVQHLIKNPNDTE